MSTVRLNKVEPIAVRNGGYRIGFHGRIPKGANLALSLNGEQGIDVTGKSPARLLNKDNLPSFLDLIDEEQLWGKSTTCQLNIKKDGQLIHELVSAPFDCPVHPYVGDLTPADIGQDRTGLQGGHSLKYTGNGSGRMLSTPAIGNRYYFTWGGKFVTDDAMRGFDCITYAGATFGIDPTTGALAERGDKLAVYMGASPCGLEKVKKKAIIDFFEKKPLGTYLMWHISHVVVVHNSLVHEFSQSHGGYRCTPISAWGFKSGDHWVRETPMQF